MSHVSHELDSNVGKKWYVVAESAGSFIVQHVARSNLLSEIVTYEQVVILERMFATWTKDGLLLNIMKLPVAIKEHAFG